jgi:hypothetical protein
MMCSSENKAAFTARRPCSCPKYIARERRAARRLGQRVRYSWPGGRRRRGTQPRTCGLQHLLLVNLLPSTKRTGGEQVNSDARIRRKLDWVNGRFHVQQRCKSLVESGARDAGLREAIGYCVIELHPAQTSQASREPPSHLTGPERLPQLFPYRQPPLFGMLTGWWM